MEFLIRPTETTFFEDLQYSQLPQVLRPNSIPSEQIEGWGSHRIRVQNCEVVFSDEMVGIQIFFEGASLSLETMRQIVSEIAENLKGVSNQDVIVIECEPGEVMAF